MYNRLPLNSLLTFSVAAEELSFQNAAEVLFVTPSAVSHQIRNLEKLLGYKLFKRLDKSVELTVKGKRLFNEIREPLKQLQQASRRAFRGLDDRGLTLSVAPAFATGWLLPRLSEFYAEYPEISLSVIATTEMAVFGSDGFDASIRVGLGDWDGLIVDRLFGREIIAVCHPSLVGENKILFKPEELMEFPLIDNECLPRLWNEWRASAELEESDWQAATFCVQGSSQIVEVLQSGHGVGLVDRNLFPVDLSSGRIVQACEHVLADQVGYYLAYPQESEELESLRCFREWLLQTI